MRSASLSPFFAVALVYAIASSAADMTPTAASVVGCTPQQVKTVESVVLRGTEIACIMGGLGSDLVDPEAIAKVCQIHEGLDKIAPIIRELVGVRNAAKRAGVVYRDPSTPPSDAAAQPISDAGAADAQ